MPTKAVDTTPLPHMKLGLPNSGPSGIMRLLLSRKAKAKERKEEVKAKVVVEKGLRGVHATTTKRVSAREATTVVTLMKVTVAAVLHARGTVRAKQVLPPLRRELPEAAGRPVDSGKRIGASLATNAKVVTTKMLPHQVVVGGHQGADPVLG